MGSTTIAEGLTAQDRVASSVVVVVVHHGQLIEWVSSFFVTEFPTDGGKGQLVVVVGSYGVKKILHGTIL